MPNLKWPHAAPDDGGQDDPLTAFIPPADEVPLRLAPRDFRPWILDEFRGGAREQLQKAYEDGEIEARQYDNRADALRHAAELAEEKSREIAREALELSDRYHRELSDLSGFRRRPVDHKWAKWLRWGLLIGGDICGVTGAAILMGEAVPLAALQATSIGAAVVCLGALGRDLRFLAAQRARHLKVTDE